MLLFLFLQLPESCSLELRLRYTHATCAEARVDRVVVHCGPVESEEIQPPSRVRVLEVGREHELQNVLDTHLGANVRELRRLLGYREQENVSLFVCGFCII